MTRPDSSRKILVDGIERDRAVASRCQAAVRQNQPAAIPAATRPPHRGGKSTTGRISIVPRTAPGILAAHLIASSRLAASIR